MTATTAGQTEHVLEVLDRARARVASARRMLSVQQQVIAAATRALSEAERNTRWGVHAEGPARLGYLQEAANDMGVVEFQSGKAAATHGTQVVLQLEAAATLVDDARESIDEISRNGLSTEEVADLTTLGVRVEALGEVLTLALPMATNANEHLRDAEATAARARHLESDTRALLSEVNTAMESVSIVSRDLGRAEQDGRQLERVIERAESSSHRIAGHADVIHEAAKSRTTKPAPSGLLDYPQVLGLNVNDELLLLVYGASPEANQLRLERARSIVDQEAEFSDNAYREATETWSAEPEVLSPTVAHILVRHDGDTKQAVQDPQMVEHLANRLGYRAGMTPFPDAGNNTKLLWSSTTPMDEDPAGREVVRNVLNKLRAEVGVDPINAGDFQDLAGLGGLPEIGPPPPPPSPAQGTSDAARDRLNTQSRNPTPGAATREPPRPGR